MVYSLEQVSGGNIYNMLGWDHHLIILFWQTARHLVSNCTYLTQRHVIYITFITSIILNPKRDRNMMYTILLTLQDITCHCLQNANNYYKNDSFKPFCDPPPRVWMRWNRVRASRHFWEGAVVICVVTRGCLSSTTCQLDGRACWSSKAFQQLLSHHIVYIHSTSKYCLTMHKAAKWQHTSW